MAIGFHAGAFEAGGEGGQFAGGGAACDVAVVVGAFENAEAQGGGDNGRARLGSEIVEFGAVLARDLEDIFESRGGDQGGAGAFALEQRVGGDGGPVDDVGAGAAGCAVEAFKNDGCWRGGVGPQFECFDGAVVA